MVHHSHLRSLRQAMGMLALMALGLLMAWVLPVGEGFGKVESYLPAHTMLEMFSVVVAVLVFASGWNAYSRALPGNAVILACTFLGVAALDFSHAMSYAGMPDFVTPSSPQKAINFWLAARMMAAVGLLMAVLTPARPFSSALARHGWLVGALAVVALAHGVFLYRPEWVPVTFVPGVGLTAFKVWAEYFIIGLYLVSGAVLWQRMKGPQNFNAAALFGAVCAMALSECFFTLYLRVHDVYNLLGHLYKVVAYLFLYRAVFVEVIEEPYREMAAMRDQLKATLDAVPDVLLEVDLQGRYHAVHTPQPELLVRPQDDLVGKTVDEVLPPDGARAAIAALQEALIKGRSVGTQLELPVPNGRRWFELSVSRKGEAMGGNTRFIVLSRDVTERRQAEAAIRAQEAANQASRAKSEFLSRMSHELRTPLNAVIGFGQLLLHSGNARLSGGQKLYVEHILSAGQHLLEMINDILDLTRIESGHSDVVVEPVRVGTWLADSLPMILPQAEARGVTVLAEKALGDQREILGDHRRLKQVLINVLSNAIKYNRSGGRVTITSDQQGDALALTITDTGTGMNAEQLQRLFEPFNRLGAERAGIEGTGLGLVISRRLIEAMGGTIGVDSTPGTGTVVTLRLPLAGAGQSRPSADTAPRPDDGASAEARQAHATVLCIEDNPLNAALLRAIFDLRPSLTLLMADTGQRGLEQVQAGHPDLVLIDLNLPDMRGEEVLRAIRQMPQGRHLSCIAMSADVSGDPPARAREQGFVDFWPKPLDVDGLLQHLDGALAALDNTVA